jgi:hypothetical protein
VEFRHGRATVIAIGESQTFLHRPHLNGTRNPKEAYMTYATMHPIAAKPIPLRELMPWGIFGTLLFAIFVYFVGAEQGATAVMQGETVHEYVHDARHLLGFPCH